MIPAAVRRVALAGPPASPLASYPGVRVGLSLQQCRMSSSKPSSPDGSKNLADVHASASSRTSNGKAASEKRKRRAKDALDRDDSFRHLPSVPSTQHMSQEAIGLSTFFSLHRPISVTHSLPKTVSDESFAAIFQPKSKAAKMSEVINTLQGAVDDIEGPMAKLELSSHHDLSDPSAHPHPHAADGTTKIDVKYPDGRESSIYVQLNSMVGNFLPFQPPPKPVPQTREYPVVEPEGTVVSASALSEATEVEGPQHRVYKATFTIEETTEADGNVRVVAHSPEIVTERRVISRRQRFQEGLRRAHERGPMMAISVKRQRKLKMKKKKYKKFMKRTRNLRRKLDRL